MTTDERDQLGRAAFEAYEGLPLYASFDDESPEVRDQWRQAAEAVRAAVLAGDPFVAALWRLALAAYEISPIGERDDEDEFQEAVRAIIERPEWQARQEQQ